MKYLNCILFALILAIPSVAIAQTGDASKVDDPRNQEIEDFFNNMQRAFSSGKGWKIEKYFSVDQLIQSTEDRGLLEPKRTIVDEAIVTGIKRGTDQSLKTWAEWLAWDKHDIRNLEFTDDSHAVALVRHWDDDLEIYTKYRWWLIRENGTWKFYDFADLDLNLRTSTLLNLMLRSSPQIHYTLEADKDEESWMPTFLKVIQAIKQLGSIEALAFNMDELQDDIDVLLEVDTPDEVRMFGLMLKTTYQLQQEDGDEWALELCDEMSALSADSPIVHILRGNGLYNLERYDEAIVSFQKYTSHFGWDADVCELIADAHLGNGDNEQAVGFAEKGLADNAGAWGCLASLAIALPNDQKKKLDAHFERISSNEGAMEYVIDWAYEMEDMAAVKHVYHLLRKTHPESELIRYYQELFDQ